MRQTWRELLFAHWEVPAELLTAELPDGLELDRREGRAYLGVVPFRMEGVAPRWLPAVPGLSAFPELNLRTYVVRDGKPGVWFFSLDAHQRLAVAIAKAAFHLPYRYARMACRRASGSDEVHYTSELAAEPGIGLEAHYRPVGDVERARPGTLEHWLTERYCLYARSRRGRLYRGEIHHGPWPLQPAEARFERLDYGAPLGPSLARPPVSLLYAERLDVVVWRLERLT